jgi:protein SCO1/2
MRVRQWAAVGLAGVAGFAAVFLCIALMTTGRPTGPTAGIPAIGGPFELVDDNDKPVSDKQFAGKPFAMYFGYTFCPEVCPTTLLDLSRWIKDLGSDANKLNYAFVSIDPERDTPKLLHAYLSSFDPHIRGFTGTSEQIVKIAREYRVYYKKIPTGNGSYVMDHSSIMYLMGADGKMVSAIAYQEDDASALKKLRSLIATSPSS